MKKEIIAIKNLTLEETLKLKDRILTNAEVDKLLQTGEWRKYEDAFPVRTALYMKYKKGATTAQIHILGENEETVKLPLKDGWYSTDKKYGLPNGKKSDHKDAKARKLWRWQDRDWEGLVVRGDYFFGYYRRDVVCGYDASDRCGVLVEREVKE